MNRLEPSATATAHRFWDQEWQEASGRADWSEPDPRVLDCIQTVVRGGGTRALDLGCGIGRHALAMATAGLQTTGMDASPSGLAEFTREAHARGLTVEAVEGSIHELPFGDACFDYVLSFNVIYHGVRAEVERAVSEIARVLPRGGLFQGTLLSKRNTGFGVGTEIEPGVMVMPPEPGSDKDHPHFYCDARELVALLEEFEILELHDSEQRKPGSWHWCFIAVRK